LAFAPVNTSTLVAYPLSVLSEQPRAEEYLCYNASSPFKVTKTYNMWDIVGVSKAAYTADWDRFASAPGGSPNEEIFLQLSTGSTVSGGTDISTVAVRIRIDFTCEWGDRPVIPAS
uniref:hypothetical protein n=1 Tax=Shewanella sp. TaxID=50422 RepID=UPI00404847C6